MYLSQSESEPIGRAAATAFLSRFTFPDSSDLYRFAGGIASIPSFQFKEIKYLSSALDKASLRFVGDAIRTYTISPKFNGSSKAMETGAKLTIACLIAPIMIADGANNSSIMAAYCTEHIATSVTHIFRTQVHAINWQDKEITDYVLGVAILLAADHRDTVPMGFENIIWLGQNSTKLKHMTKHIKEVSAERDYLESVLDLEAHSLREGML